MLKRNGKVCQRALRQFPLHCCQSTALPVLPPRLYPAPATGRVSQLAGQSTRPSNSQHYHHHGYSAERRNAIQSSSAALTHSTHPHRSRPRQQSHQHLHHSTLPQTAFGSKKRCTSNLIPSTLLPTSSKLYNPSQDPELASYMNRWIRRVIHGQKRCRSNLAISVLPPNPSLPFNSTRDLSAFQTLSTPLAIPGADSSHTPISQRTLQEQCKLDRFQKALHGICLDDRELSPKFRPSAIIVNKPPRSKKDRDKANSDVEAIWEAYKQLSKTQQSLTRQDYSQLIKIVRHTPKVKTAARRILALENDTSKHGHLLTNRRQLIVIQAHFALQQIPEATKIYERLMTVIQQGTLEERRLLWTMVDSFVTNRQTTQGLRFLYSIRIADSSLAYQLYQRLSACHFASKAIGSFPRHNLDPIRQFQDQPFPPSLDHLTQVLEFLERGDTTGSHNFDLLQQFSIATAGMFVHLGRQDLLSALLASLLRKSHMREATRLLDSALQHLQVDLKYIRRELLRTVDTCDRPDEREKVLEQWDAVVSKRRVFSITSDPAFRSDLSPVQQSICSDYAGMVSECIRCGDIQGALKVATYMSRHGWEARQLDFYKLNSVMTNFGQSDQYLLYIQLRYTLGGDSVPDLHTYRRLVYAACRRSDLFSALGLFKEVRTRHPSWTLDTSLYNAIMSTAAALGHIRVAEKTLSCLIEDGAKPDRYTFHALLNGYSVVGDLEAALMIPEQMAKLKLAPTTKTFNLVIKAYLGARRDMATTRKLFDAMQKSSTVPPDLVTFNQLLEGYRRVGNIQWFDTYFDRYFANPRMHDKSSTSASALPELAPVAIVESSQRSESADKTLSRSVVPKKVESRRKIRELTVRPERPDDKTLLIQLKHSLLLPDLDLASVLDLWCAIEPGLGDAPFVPHITAEKHGPTIEGKHSRPCLSPVDVDPRHGHSADSSTPPTHVPFRQKLGRLLTPATDHDHFRFTLLTLFRQAFRSRGYLPGMKKVDKRLALLFPDQISSAGRDTKTSGAVPKWPIPDASDQ